MKTNTRSFSSALFCAIAVITTMLVAPVKVEGQGVINTYMGLGPVNATPTFVSDVTYALANGLSSYGSWTEIPNGTPVLISSIFDTGSSGQAMYAAFSSTQPVPFTLASVYSTQTSPFFNFAGTLGADGITYTMFGYGKSADGTTYVTGNQNTPVTSMFCIGYNYGININGMTPAQALTTYSKSLPFDFSVSYTADGVTATSCAHFVSSVPEPSVLSLASLGFITLILYWNRKMFKATS
jgi:hypothetical protein